ncbi:MAG: twin-arginine translocase TatA/TatE family subunit [Bradymonadia bacterium]
MLPGGIGFWEILVILAVVLLVMGPAKIPEVARTLGKGIRAARRAGQEIRDAIDPDEYRRQFRSWEMNHRIEDGQLDTSSHHETAQQNEAAQMDEGHSPSVPGTVSRGDGFGTGYDHVDDFVCEDSEHDEPAPGPTRIPDNAPGAHPPKVKDAPLDDA